MDQSVLQSHGTILLASFLPSLINEKKSPTPAAAQSEEQPMPSTPTAESEDEDIGDLVRRHLSGGSPTPYDDVIEEVERKLLTEMLEQCGGNQTEAAKRLGITRTTVRSKVNKLGIGIRRIVE